MYVQESSSKGQEVPHISAAWEHAHPCRHQAMPQGDGICCVKQRLPTCCGSVSSTASGISRAAHMMTSFALDGRYFRKCVERRQEHAHPHHAQVLFRWDSWLVSSQWGAPVTEAKSI